jgi:hypothetical protein
MTTHISNVNLVLLNFVAVPYVNLEHREKRTSGVYPGHK